MASVNEVRIMGRIGNIESAQTKSGIEVCNLSVATNKKIKDKSTGKYEEKTSWHRIKCFGQTANYLNQYGKKGSLTYIIGSLEYGKYEKDGVTHYTTDIFAKSAQLIGGKNDSQENGSPTINPDFTSDNIPF
jgi:single-strand DNA-binding protein